MNLNNEELIKLFRGILNLKNEWKIMHNMRKFCTLCQLVIEKRYVNIESEWRDSYIERMYKGIEKRD